MTDLIKVATITAHYNRVATDTHLFVTIGQDYVGISIHKNMGCDIVKSWRIVPACDIDKIIVEILQELTNN